MSVIRKIIRYLLHKLIPAFGLLCIICAGNWQTRLIGVIIIILDLFEEKN